MKAAEFPCYKSAEIASRWGCFNCHNELDVDTLTDSGNAPTRGQFRMKCQKCGMSTWFDLEPQE